MRIKQYKRWWVFSVVVAVCFVVTGLGAQNLVSDPGFDNSLMPAWTPGTAYDNTWSWDSRDVNDSATSGSGSLENLYDGLNMYTVVRIQCIEGVDDTKQYDFGGRALYPTGQAFDGSAEAFIQLISYDSPGCSTGLDNEQSAHITVSEQAGSWVLTSANDVSLAPGTESVGFAVSVQKGDSVLTQRFSLTISTFKRARFFEMASSRATPRVGVLGRRDRRLCALGLTQK